MAKYIKNEWGKWVDADTGVVQQSQDFQPAEHQILSGNTSGGDYYAHQKRVADEAAAAEQKRVADLAAQGLNPDGSPIRKEFDSQIDPATGLLKSQYQIAIDAVRAGKLDARTLDKNNLEGFQGFRKEAMRTGPSQWANLELRRQKMEEGGARDDATKQALQAQAQARAGLSMRGGLSSGARERIAMQGSRDLLGANQAVGRQGALSRAELMSKDESNRINQLGQFAGMESDVERFNVGQLTNADQYNMTNTLSTDKWNSEAKARAGEANIKNALMEVGNKRSYDTDTYQEQMKKWAANKQAEATANSGGGGK